VDRRSRALIGATPFDLGPALPTASTFHIGRHQRAAFIAPPSHHSSPPPVLELEAEPLAEHNDGGVVAELACPAHWNG